MTAVALDAESHAFPRELLGRCSSALLLFASGRMGAADGVWVREARIRDVTAVDWDPATLEPFQDVYPPEWHYVLADVFGWVEHAQRKWDLVSADAPSQLAGRLGEMLPRYCKLARRYVTATVSTSDGTDAALPQIPAGWAVRSFEERAQFKGRRFWWLVLERELTVAFDDGPSGFTDEILDELDDAAARAIFYVNGKNIAGREHILRRIVEEGHEIGNHGWSHEPMDEMPGSEVLMEIAATEEAIVGACGVYPSRFRPPFRRFGDHGAVDGYTIDLESSIGDYNMNAGEIIEACGRVDGMLWLHEIEQTVEALPVVIAERA